MEVSEGAPEEIDEGVEEGEVVDDEAEVEPRHREGIVGSISFSEVFSYQLEYYATTQTAETTRRRRRRRRRRKMEWRASARRATARRARAPPAPSPSTTTRTGAIRNTSPSAAASTSTTTAAATRPTPNSRPSNHFYFSFFIKFLYSNFRVQGFSMCFTEFFFKDVKSSRVLYCSFYWFTTGLKKFTGFESPRVLYCFSYWITKI